MFQMLTALKIIPSSTNFVNLVPYFLEKSISSEFEQENAIVSKGKF